MIAPEDVKLTQRVQTLGRSMVTNLYQLFRSAEIYEENNEIFRRISDSMRTQIEESYRYLNSCNLKISNHNIYVSRNRIFIDFGILESVRSLSKIFAGANVGGMNFLEDCLDIHNLIRGLLAFRDTIVLDQRKGVDAIKKGMIERHTPFIEPMPEDIYEVKVTGLRDVFHAKEFALKNAIKLIIFLENMHESYQTGKQAQISIIYRIILNLMRVLEHHPSIIKELMSLKVPNKAIHDQYYCALLLLSVLGHFKAKRQDMLNLVVDSLFHNMGRLTSKKFLDARQASDAGARKLLETRFINRSFFYRVNYAYHTPLNEAVQSGLEFCSLFKTIVAFVHQLKSRELHQTAVINLLKSKSAEIHKPSVLLIAKTLGLLVPGQSVILDRKKPGLVSHWKNDKMSAELQVTTLDPVNKKHIEHINWDFEGEKEWLGYLKRLSIPSPTLPAPNPINVIFKS
ncbi:MAG: hypothetical protein CSA81_08505 [Acidobacteria bacterium]|nr:MAG: hypothetical protein CSA81_08505 [Acidobacteriota bacterium]